MAQCFIYQGNSLMLVNDVPCTAYMMLTADEYQQWQDTASFWTYSQDHFQIGFGMVLLSWVVGLGVGLCFSMVRKLRY